VKEQGAEHSRDLPGGGSYELKNGALADLGCGRNREERSDDADSAGASASDGAEEE